MSGLPLESLSSAIRDILNGASSMKLMVVRGMAPMRPAELLIAIYQLSFDSDAQVKAQAESEGLDKIFIDAGFEWRDAGCSMCLGMNPDFLLPGERCASTSNRNFEGRQGQGGRTHLVSPAMAAAAAIAGHFVDVRTFN